MKYKAIIFDMDGTIIDTEHIWSKATRELITRRGIEFTPEIEAELSQKLNGLGMVESCQIIKDLINLQEELHELVAEKSAHADQLYEEGIRFIEGFAEFHTEVLKFNLKVGLATNATPETVHITNKKLNLEQFFGIHMYNISHVKVGKPNPELYLHAAAQLGIDPKECVAIEDSSHGVEAATAAGMFCIGINTSKKPERLAKSHLVIDTYNEINLIRLLKIKS